MTHLRDGQADGRTDGQAEELGILVVGWMQERGAISGMDWMTGRGMEHLAEQKSKPEIVDKSSVPSH